MLEQYRRKNILDYSPSDDRHVSQLFQEFLCALEVSTAGQVKQSPVATAKALHLLAPAYFPLWDETIAREYGCDYSNSRLATDRAAQYLKFMKLCQRIAARFAPPIGIPATGKTLLKVIDEYNYVKFTERLVPDEDNSSDRRARADKSALDRA